MKSSFISVVFVLLASAAGVFAQDSEPVCTTNRTAPPVSTYSWPPDTTVKVYFMRDMFTAEQRTTLFAAMSSWTAGAEKVGAGVRFVDAGDTDGKVSCKGCLTITRREVHKYDKKRYAYFFPLKLDRNGWLESAWIDFDYATTNPKALQGYMAHELGHGMGLWDCPNCQKNRSIMSGFPGINRDNGLISPSACDLEVVRGIYRHTRNVALNSPASVSETALAEK